MFGGPIKRLGRRVWLGLLLIPLAALAASPPDLLEFDSLELERHASQQPEQERLPFTVTLQKQIPDDRVRYQLLVQADPSQVDIASATVVAHIRSSTGFSAVRTLPGTTGGRWMWSLSPDEPARYRIDLEASGKSPEGESLRMALSSQYFKFPEPGDPYISVEERALAAMAQGLEDETEMPELAPLKTPEAAPETAKVPPSHKATAAVSRVMLYGSILTSCFVALALIAFGYQIFINRRRAGRSKAAQDAENPESVSSPSMQDIGPDDDWPSPEMSDGQATEKIR